MKIRNDTVIFDPCDLAFGAKFGYLPAAEMALEHHSLYPKLPFLYDCHQLAAFLGTSSGKLNHMVRHIQEEYHTVTNSKDNGKSRQLSVPSRELRFYQGKIANKILTQLPVSEYATAYRKGSSIRRNAEPHIRKKYLLKLDITNFFGSVSFAQIYGTVFHTIYSKQVSYLLTSLCCLNGALPQGATTSPLLSNIVMRRFDHQIGQWCHTHDIAYTRYCDDMTFSADHSLYHVREKVSKHLHKMGFVLNEAKTHFITKAGRQCVTGLTVNEKISIPSDYKRALRQETYYALRFGLSQAIIRGNRTAFLLNGQPDEACYLAHLLGKIQYVLQIEPENQWFRSAAAKLHFTS